MAKSVIKSLAKDKNEYIIDNPNNIYPIFFSFTYSKQIFSPFFSTVESNSISHSFLDKEHCFNYLNTKFNQLINDLFASTDCYESDSFEFSLTSKDKETLNFYVNSKVFDNPIEAKDRLIDEVLPLIFSELTKDDGEVLEEKEEEKVKDNCCCQQCKMKVFAPEVIKDLEEEIESDVVFADEEYSLFLINNPSYLDCLEINDSDTALKLEGIKDCLTAINPVSTKFTDIFTQIDKEEDVFDNLIYTYDVSEDAKDIKVRYMTSFIPEALIEAELLAENK